MEVSSKEIDDWFSMDGPGYEHLDDNGIVDLIVNADVAEPDSDEEPEALQKEPMKCPVSNAEAMEMFDKCLLWLRWQEEASVANTATLVQLREIAAEKRRAARVQPKIHAFFRPK